MEGSGSTDRSFPEWLGDKAMNCAGGGKYAGRRWTIKRRKIRNFRQDRTTSKSLPRRQRAKSSRTRRFAWLLIVHRACWLLRQHTAQTHIHLLGPETLVARVGLDGQETLKRHLNPSVGWRQSDTDS